MQPHTNVHACQSKCISLRPNVIQRIEQTRLCNKSVPAVPVAVTVSKTEKKINVVAFNKYT